MKGQGRRGRAGRQRDRRGEEGTARQWTKILDLVRITFQSLYDLSRTTWCILYCLQVYKDYLMYTVTSEEVALPVGGAFLKKSSASSRHAGLFCFACGGMKELHSPSTQSHMMTDHMIHHILSF